MTKDEQRKDMLVKHGYLTVNQLIEKLQELKNIKKNTKLMKYALTTKQKEFCICFLA